MSEFIDTVHPKLRSVVKDFLAKCNYPFEVSFCGGYLIEADGVDKYRSGVCFIDPNVPNVSSTGRNPAIAGAFKLVSNKTGKDKFRIVTRHVQKERAKDHEARRSVESVSDRNALKALLTHITPIHINEIAEDKESLANGAIREWKEEFSGELYRSFKTLPQSSIIEEVQHLQSLGVKFKTAAFQHIAETAIAAFIETKRRKDTRIDKYFVMLRKDGSAVITDPRENVNIFDRFELLPLHVQESIGILKLMDTNKSLPEIGVNVGGNMFWVFQKVEE